MHRLSVMAAAVLLAAPLVAQNPPQQFGEKIEVNAVLVDAIVTDHTGHQILGLDKNDFVITENGVPQTIDSVDYFTNRRLLTAPEQQAAFKVERVREERYFVFFFDKPDNNLLYDRLQLARQATKHFIMNEMLPTDRVAIAGDDKRLKIYSDFTNDKNQLVAALYESAGYGRGLTERVPDRPDSIMAHINTSAMINHTGTVFQALEVLGDGLHAIHARKNLILFSPGIRGLDETVQHGMIINQSQYYQPMVRALNGANVSVYGINLQEATTNELPLIHQNLERTSNETAGEYYRTVVGFETVLKRIENENNGYYLITYYSHHARGTSGYQRIQVSLKNPEFRVKAREGYSF